MNNLTVNRNISQFFSSEEIIDINKITNQKSLNELLNVHTKVVLLGEPGVGKSFELNKLFISYWNSRNTTLVFPIFINLKKYQNRLKFEDLIPFQDWKTLPNIIFILDGLDETAYPHDFISILEAFINTTKEKNYKFIISSRTNIYLNHQLQLESFKSFKLHPLNVKQINIILKNKGIIYEDINQNFLNKYPFFDSPFFLNALIEYYEEHQKWLESESEIWNYYIDKTLRAYEQKEKKKRKVLLPQEKKWLRTSALVNELQAKNLFTEEELYSLFNHSFASFVNNPFIQKTKKEDFFSFEHRQYQEYFASVVLKELTFKNLKEIICVNGIERVRSYLANVVSLLLSISDDVLFEELSYFLIKNDIEILIKSDSLRITANSKFKIFKNYFSRQCIEKSLWIGTNSSISDIDLAQFSDSLKSFNFLIEVIENKNLHFRARISAINLLQYFTSINEEYLIETIETILASNESISFKSTIVRLINLLDENKRSLFLKEIIENFSGESNKEWNRSLLAILSELNNIDEFFEYLKREFNWANKLIERDEPDEVHRGNSWIMMDLVLRLNNETNFLELVPYYMNDYNLKTHDTFKENLIDKCIKFENESNGFIIKILKKIKEDDKIESLHNDDVLSALIKKTKNELEAFKVLFDDENSNTVDSLFLAKITTKETIDFFVRTFNLSNDNRIKLQVYRNMISNYGERELAFYLEEKLIERGVNMGERMPSEEESLKFKEQLAKEVQENADLLFHENKLISKVKSAIPKENRDEINYQVINKLERSHFDLKKNWFRGLGCQFDVLYASVKLYPNSSLPEIENKIKDSKRIQIVALKGMLEYNKTAQYKFELSNEHIEYVKTWLKKESQAFNFEDLVHFNSITGFTIKRMSDYKLLKTLFYFVDIDEYQDSFDESFLLNSIVYYRMEESSPFSEPFEKLLELINDKVKLKQKIITSIQSKVFIFPLDRIVVYALKNNYSEVYPNIEEFLEISTHSPGDKVFDLYIEKTSDWDLLKKISNDLSNYKGWSALKELSQRESEQSFCTEKCLNYLSGDISEFKSNALGILFKLNHQKALDFFIEGIDMNPLYNIAVKYRTEFNVPTEVFIEKFDELFLRIYQTKVDKDEFDRDWEFSENNTFFTQLITNVLKNSTDKTQTYHQLSQKLQDVQASSKDDRIIFFANSINEILKNNYISIMAEPLTFEEAMAITDQIVK